MAAWRLVRLLRKRSLAQRGLCAQSLLYDLASQDSFV
jgi:hypothetical protein